MLGGVLDSNSQHHGRASVPGVNPPLFNPVISEVPEFILEIGVTAAAYDLENSESTTLFFWTK